MNLVRRALRRPVARVLLLTGWRWIRKPDAPLATLAAALSEMVEHPTPGRRVPQTRADATGLLAKDINRLLDRLEQQDEILRKSEERSRLLIEGSNELVAEVDEAGQCLHASLAFKEQFGGGADGLSRASLFDRIHPEDLGAFREGLAQPLASMIHRIRGKDGDWRWLETLSRRLTGDPAKVRTVLLARDVTERVKAQRSLQEKTAELDRFFNASLELLCIADVQGRFRRLNPLWAQVLGWTLAELEGQRFLDFVHPDDLGSTLVAVEQLSQQKSVTRFLNRYRCKDGSYRWLEWASFPAGEMIYAVAHDVTERKRAEAALAQSEQNYREIFNSTSEAIFIHDHSGAIVDVNRPSCELFGCNRTELLGRSIGDLSADTPPHSHTEAQAKVQLALAGKPQLFEWLCRHRDGHTFWAEVALRTARILGRDCVIADVRDISTRKAVEAQIQQLNAELEQRVTDRTAQLAAANRELESFSYSVSHDLRAPLRAIEGFSKALEEDCAGQLPPEGLEHLRRVRAATVQMARLIDDLLELSRTSRAALRCTELDLSALARDILDRLHQSQPQRKAEVYIAGNIVARADPILMRAALENLLGNAWKYTRQRALARIEFGRTQTDGVPVYYVRDNGAGFDMAYADKLFGAFQRLHGQHEFEGTGVGLASVQRIIHRHGGRVWAEGQVNAGATFYFTLATAGTEEAAG